MGSNIMLLMLGKSSKPAPSTKNSRPPAIETYVSAALVVSFLKRKPWSRISIFGKGANYIIITAQEVAKYNLPSPSARVRDMNAVAVIRTNKRIKLLGEARARMPGCDFSLI